MILENSGKYVHNRVNTNRVIVGVIQGRVTPTVGNNVVGNSQDGNMLVGNTQ